MIVTHTNPDMDAITGVWLLKRFGYYGQDHIILEPEKVVFVNTGNPDPELLAKATAVVDTGREYDPDRLRFDHHHLHGAAANDTCATAMVYQWLLTKQPELKYLGPLVGLVFFGDTGRREADASRELGLHAIFSGWKAWFAEQNPDVRLADEVAMVYGFGLLDVLEVRLRKQTEAKGELDQKTVYKSVDGLVWAIKHGSSGSTFAAYDEGARVVVFEGEPIEVEGGVTYPIGIMRAGEWQEPHVGQLADSVNDPKLAAEIATWFKHPAGFFAGRGTAKAPVFEPITIDMVSLAQAISIAWQR